MFPDTQNNLRKASLTSHLLGKLKELATEAVVLKAFAHVNSLDFYVSRVAEELTIAGEFAVNLKKIEGSGWVDELLAELLAAEVVFQVSL